MSLFQLIIKMNKTTLTFVNNCSRLQWRLIYVCYIAEEEEVRGPMRKRKSYITKKNKQIKLLLFQS